jgi:hypothetical protein
VVVRRPNAITTFALLVGVGFGLLGLPKPQPATSTIPHSRPVGHVTAQERAATFTFPPGLAPADRDVILTAVAHARPEAQAIIAAIDGLVDIRVGQIPGASGMASPTGDRFLVSLDLAMVSRAAGQRAIDMLVLHELGHVIDFALIGPELDAQLDAGIPRGYGCDVMERFAESFAKWSTGDIGVNLNLGYKVPPPGNLDAWGASLVGLGDA